MVSLLMFGSTPVFWSESSTEGAAPVGATLGHEDIAGDPLAGEDGNVLATDDGATRVTALSLYASRERPVQPLSLAMRESVTATILEILQELDPHGYLAEGGAPNVYYEPASFLGWNVNEAEDITLDEVLARVEAAFGWDHDTPPPDLAGVYVEAAERIMADVVWPMRRDRRVLMRECA